MDVIQITIEVKEELQEILISQLEELHSNGFEQTENYLIAYFPENNFRSYEIEQLLREYTFSITTLKEQNWNQVWESNFHPVIVDRFCAVRADFHQPVNDVVHEIIITPKMSFGTGHHATTYMMMKQMECLDIKGKNVFDFGTGTGILAILAEKLGAATVSAIDHDDWSIKNAMENIEKNNCSKISIHLSSKIPEQLFDVILANINRNVILQYLTDLKKSLQENGRILLSGLLSTDENSIVDTCHKDLRLEKRMEKDNWISLLFINQK